MSKTWLDEYLSALEARDAYEKAHDETIIAYTKLADEYAALYKTKTQSATIIAPSSKPQEAIPSGIAAAAGPASRPSTPRLPPSLLGGITARSPSPASAKAAGDAPIDHSQGDASLRADLTTANRHLRAARAEALALRNELESLRNTLATRDADAATAAGATAKLRAEKVALGRKLRDRESELTEKAALVSDVQDENAGLEMQLNVAEERAATLERENGELVARWMRRVGREADAMNEGSGWR